MKNTELEKLLKKTREELTGKSMDFQDLDNKMMSLGFFSEFDEGLDFNEISESGVIIYEKLYDDEYVYVRVEFEALTWDLDELNEIKITSVDES